MNYFPWTWTVHKSTILSYPLLVSGSVRLCLQNRTVPFFFTVALIASNPGARSLRGFFHRKLDSVPGDTELLSWNKKDGTQSTILSYPLLVSGSVRLCLQNRTVPFFFYSSFDSFKSRSQKLTRIFFHRKLDSVRSDMNYFPWNKKGRYTKYHPLISFTCFQVRSGFAYRTEQFHFSFTVALIASNPGARSLRGFFSQETGFCSERYELLSWNKKDGTQSTILSYPLLVSGSVRLLPTEPNSSIFSLQ